MHQNVMEQPELTREEKLALKNKRTGLTIFQISWIMVFICLVIVNWQLRFQYPSWPPPDVEPFSPILPTVGTIALLVSAFLARGGMKAIENGAVDAFLSQWRLALVLGIAFMGIMIFEFFNVSQAALDTQYGMVFRVMTGFHFIHALVIALIMVQVYRTGAAGGYDPRHFWAVEGTAKLWYFVAIAWILFYVVLYWI